jgi:hypothetical protein
MARRVVLGQQADGSVGLRCSAPGFDALTAADDGHAITFDSRWTDIAKVYVTGIVGLSSFVFYPTGTGSIAGYTASWPALGYKPFLELRRYNNGVVWDDYWTGGNPAGCYGAVWDGFFQISAAGGTNSGDFFLYTVYPIPVPSQ